MNYFGNDDRYSKIIEELKAKFNGNMFDTIIIQAFSQGYEYAWEEIRIKEQALRECLAVQNSSST